MSKAIPNNMDIMKKAKYEIIINSPYAYSSFSLLDIISFFNKFWVMRLDNVDIILLSF